MKKILVRCRRTLDSAAGLSITGPILEQSTHPPHAGSKPVNELREILTVAAGAGESSDTNLRKYKKIVKYSPNVYDYDVTIQILDRILTLYFNFKCIGFVNKIS
jgi:hypothetical protein